MAVGGHLEVLWEPFEYVMIVGMALGTFIVGNPKKVIMDTSKGVMQALTNAVPKRGDYLALLGLLYALMRDLRTRPRNERP